MAAPLVVAIGLTLIAQKKTLGPKLLQTQDKSLKAAYICLVHSDPHFVRCAQIGVRKTAIIQACEQRGDARSQLALCWGGLL